MDISQLEKLISDMEKLPRAHIPEATLFSVGGRGYYENPTTDILAFFCDSDGAHGLGNLVINALFSALSSVLPELLDLNDFSVISKPEREVRTFDGKRIDLLLEGNDWVMVIEHKIFHHQNNPFEAYETYIKEVKLRKGKLPIYVVLSPGGTAPTGWIGLSYKSLLQCLKDELAQIFINQPLNKWVILLREFIVHLEGIILKPTTPTVTVDFVLSHLRQLQQAQTIKQQAIEDFQKEVLQFIQKDFPNRVVRTKLDHWHGFPALRFYLDDWTPASNAVLFLDARHGKSFCIKYYCYDIKNDKQRQQADSHLQESDCVNPWNERKDSIRCYKASFKTGKKLEMKELLVHKLKLLDNFEKKVRVSW